MRRVEIEEIGKVEFVEELAEVYKVVSKLAYEYESNEREYKELYNLAELEYESDEWCTYEYILCDLNECELSLDNINEYIRYYDYYNDEM
jgi:hypothetical protein